MLNAFQPLRPFKYQWPAVFGVKSLAQQIAALFANDEEGAWYDPSDLSTLYTEWEGTLTTQSSIGGVVGTMLDKRKGLVQGPDMRDGFEVRKNSGSSVTDATFDPVTGIGQVHRIDISNVSSVVFPPTTLKWMLADIENTSAADLTVRGSAPIGGTIWHTVPANSRAMVFIRPTSPVSGVSIQPITNSTSPTFILHSLRELPGNHAQAPSDAARPVLGREPEGGVRNLLLNTGFIGGVSGTPGTVPTEWIFEFTTGTATYSGNLFIASGTDQRIVLRQNIEATANTTYVCSVLVNVIAAINLNQALVISNMPSGASVSYRIDGNDTAGGTALPLGEHLLEGIVVVGATAGTFRHRMGVGASSTSSGEVAFYDPQVEIGTDRSSYQRVGTTALDVTEAGKRDCFYLFHDLDDDKLQVTLPDLGSDVTIATGDNDGVTILTGQTVGAGVYDLPDAKSQLFGHLIIDRALTAKETETVTKFLEQKVSKP
jgi:hypothetical protein